MEAMMTPQSAGPAFFFYSPDPSPEGRQHGRFIPQQHPAMQQMNMLPVVAPLPSTPVYSRPGSSCSQPQLLPKGCFTSLPMLPSTLTPLASPMPLAHKPTIVLDTEFSEVDGLYSPSTPPLSSSGSAISSPGSCDMLQTPLNPMFSGLDGKEACGMDGELESFPALDWSACASPPLTPDDFCDPRNLTVGTVNSTLAPEFSALPTLCAGEDEDQKFVLRGATPSLSPCSTFESFEFTSQLCNSTLPSFDALSDLDSEDDFVNGLVNLSDCTATHISRSRASSDALSLSASSYLCGDDSDDFDVCDSFAADSLLSPASSCDDSDEHRNKRQKNSKDSCCKPTMSTAAESHSGTTQSQTPPANQETSSNTSSSSSESKDSAEPHSGSEGSTPLPAPTTRRGRKQSLTEDPSKTFVCDICNRRFRRQEHLKRHYRSLHTQDKPFECTECGKKFSRSDNLAQHSRTHGSGAIVMNLIDDPEALAAGGMSHAFPHSVMMGGSGLIPGDEYHNLGKVLFQIGSEVPGSGSESSSSDEGSDSGKKKRKRSD
ncbi:hypothetical protein N0V88_004387 [Collariella sp. IMI 366227]|nr:hypothetical protein N0V88_004387 [Collariella sp. IMI 366227]